MLDKLKTVNLKILDIAALRNLLAMLDGERAAVTAKEKEISELIVVKEQAELKTRGANPLGTKKIG